MQSRTLRLLKARTPDGIRVIIFDTGSPASVARETAEVAAESGYELARYDAYLTGNDCRNLAIGMVETDYVVFMENDVEVTDGWFGPLLRCLDETGAWAAMPLYLERNKGRLRVHTAGTYLWGQAEQGRTIYRQKLAEVRVPVDKRLLQSLERREVDALECHLFACRMDKWREIGPFDPKILAPHDHIDFSLNVLAAGGRIFVEPRSRVIYDPDARLRFGDLPYCMLRYSPVWVKPSLERFADKWGVDYGPGHEEWYYSTWRQFTSGLPPWSWFNQRGPFLKRIFARAERWLLRWVAAKHWVPARRLRAELFRKAAPDGWRPDYDVRCRAFGRIKFGPAKPHMNKRP